MPSALIWIKAFFFKPVEDSTIEKYRCITCKDASNGDLNTICNLHTSNRQRTHIIQVCKRHYVGETSYSVWESLEHPPWGEKLDFSCNHHQAPSSLSSYDITFIKSNGQQSRRILTCKCCHLTECLLSIGYFNCTPTTPQVAIDMEVLKEYHQLNTICHVSNHRYSEYLERNNTTKHIMNCTESYRSIQKCYRAWSLLYQQSMGMAVSFDQTARIDCPVCKTSGTATVTLDACFGATSLLKNSKLDVEPYQDHDYLLKDLTREQIQGEATDEIVDPSACVNMASKPSNVKMDSAYYKGLHYTGLMGSVCKHGFPLYFVNISHGKEKQVFGAKILSHLQRIDNFSGSWNAKYDIMCS
jgi:hypothetical protein